MDKRGVTVKLEMSNEDSQILYLKHYPDLIWSVLGTMVLLGGSLIAILTDPSVWLYCAAFLVVILYNVFTARAFTCVMNRRTGIIDYHRSGILMTPIDEQRSEHKLAEIKHLEIHQHIKGGRWSWTAVDTFEIFLALEDGEKVPLSPSNLDLRECQEFSERIRGFIGNEIPIKALD